MASVKWTPAQSDAIYARGKSIAVSAAAGSGKTAVLTRRIIERVCAEDASGDISRILVVTFTKAAAGEMRERIAKALKDEIKNNPSKKVYLKKQINLLPTADICTMDSFCAKIVRENFNLAEISSDFQIIEKSDLEVLKKQCFLKFFLLIYSILFEVHKILGQCNSIFHLLLKFF